MGVDVFIKRTRHGSESLLREAEGLELLRTEILKHCDSDLAIPKIESVDKQQLVIELIETVPPSVKQTESLAVNLARLHSAPQDYYGFTGHNFIGLAPQYNVQSNNWGEFFAEFRLLAQIKMIKAQDVQHHFLSLFERHHHRLVQWLNEGCSQSSLLHGDLWSGNVLFGQHEKVYLIDPAVYYGDREADIAMTEMFGGFSQGFYDAYNAHSPLSPDYATKREIYNLYHYLNHYNLFGDSYLEACKQRIEQLETL